MAEALMWQTFLLGGFLLSWTLLVWALYGRGKPVVARSSTMSFLEHANELRTRILRILVVFAFWTTAFTTLRIRIGNFRGFPVPEIAFDLFDNAAARTYVALSHALLPEGVQLIITKPTEALGAQIQVALLLGFLVALPFFAFECWAFFSPGLRSKERKLLARSLPFCAILFFAGVAFAFFYITPFLLKTFYAFSAPLGAIPYLAVGSLVGTFVTFAFLFGFAFQFPIVLVLLVRTRLVTPATYVRHWRHVTVGIVIVAGLVTDPTLVSQLIVAALLLVLYWGGVLTSYLLRPPVAWTDTSPSRQSDSKPS